MSDFDEDIPDLPPLPGVSDEAGGMKTGSEAAAAGNSVHDHLVMVDEGYHHHDHLHEDSDGLHLGGEAKIDSVEAAIMAVANAGRPPTSPITRSRAGQSKKQRSRCSMEGCDKQSQGARNDNMCRKHYIEYQKATNPELAAEIVKDLAMAHKKKRAKCSVEGCPKQSQGSVCNNMCRAHFVEYGCVLSPSNTPSRPRKGPKVEGMTSELPPLLADPPKVRETTVSIDGEEREWYRYLCRVEGCTRQSQGARNGQMCRRHYTLFTRASGGVDALYNDGLDNVRPDINIGDMPTDHSQNVGTPMNVNVAEGNKRSRRKSCAIPGCLKQSQGKDNLKMCRSHFRAMQKAGISPEELPQWQQSQQMEAALQAEGADFAAAVDALPPLPDTEHNVADAATASTKSTMDHHDGDDDNGDKVASGQVSGDDREGSHDDVEEEEEEEEEEGNDEELSLMIQREIQKLKKLERGENCDEHGVDQYLGDDDDDNAEAALAASTAAANPPQPGPSPKRPRLESAAPPASPNERALVKRRQQARDDVEALQAQLQAAQSKEMSVMNAMEGMEECVLCQNEAKSVTMTPCGHSAICNHCSYNENKCPICLEPIDPVDPIEEDGAVAV